MKKFRNISVTLGSAALIAITAAGPANAECQSSGTQRVGDTDTTQCVPVCRTLRCR